MAHGHLMPVETANLAELRRLLAQEWTIAGGAAEPVIIEQPSGSEGYMRLYVLWRAWQSVPQQERSRIIMEAYKETHTLDELLNVTIAMGLTPDEAHDMGLNWTTE